MGSSIQGLQEAQAANLQLIAAMRPAGVLGRAVTFGTASAHRAAVASTVVDTGAWRASHRMQVSGLRGQIDLDASARNPRSGTLVREYASTLTQRGGRYDVYAAVETRHGQAIAATVRTQLFGALP